MHEHRMSPAVGWWAAYDEDSRQFVVPVVCFDEAGMPYVWNAETHRPVAAVRTSFVAIVSDAYRGEYGELIAAAIKSAHAGHRGTARLVDDPATSEHGSDTTKDKLHQGIEKARDVIHDATGPDR
jgi:hypothetical protein